MQNSVSKGENQMERCFLCPKKPGFIGFFEKMDKMFRQYKMFLHPPGTFWLPQNFLGVEKENQVWLYWGHHKGAASGRQEKRKEGAYEKTKTTLQQGND